jgi:hypothetical protein
MNRPLHLSDDELIRRLYGLEDAHSCDHLEACLECLRRWESIRERRETVVRLPELSTDALRQQRIRIMDRLEQGAPPVWRRKWAAAAAAVAIIGAGLWFTRPQEKPLNFPENAGAEFVDAGWYEDAYSDMQPVEPRAATPIRELFNDEAVGE